MQTSDMRLASTQERITDMPPCAHLPRSCEVLLCLAELLFKLLHASLGHLHLLGFLLGQCCLLLSELPLKCILLTLQSLQ